ncbi:hypothetical protein ACHAXN_012421 [Cyclotella atomus]
MAVELTNQEGGSSSSVIIPLLPIHQKQPSEASEPLIDNIPTSTKRQALQLLFGAGGIYASFLYYGSLQEDVFRYAAQDGTKFNHVWYLQVLESLANVAFGVIALTIIGLTRSDKSKGWWGGTPNLPKKPFLSTGLTQVCSKGFTSLALANGLSFPVATLAKSGKMAPVMMGSLILGGATYSLREYFQVLAIIAGTAILSMGKKKSSSDESSALGVIFILLALAMDGLTGGVQKKLLSDLKRVNITAQPYDLMTYTNAFMMLFALLVAVVTNEFSRGLTYCRQNPEVFQLIWKFSLCSAIGQSFIFYTLARFDPLVCSTVTTTRKIFSVILSILLKGHNVSMQGWMGLGLAVGGILSEMSRKVYGDKKFKSKTSM